MSKRDGMVCGCGVNKCETIATCPRPLFRPEAVWLPGLSLTEPPPIVADLRDRKRSKP